MRAMPSAHPGLEPELMDRDTIDPEENRRALADLDRVTLALFGLGALRKALMPRLRRGMLFLDVGAGSGFAALDLRRRTERHGQAVRVVCLDRRLRHLVAGRRLPGVAWRVVGDAGALPFRDRSIDWAASSLFFHHFDGPGNDAVVGEMRRVARRGVAIADLRRTPWGPWLLRFFFFFLGVGRVARHDGLVSLRRAWSLAEVERWLAKAPLRYELRRRFPVRFSLIIDAER
jgi:ubiquinone/menaquinone biosynthesis C-methylase UbiE